MRPLAHSFFIIPYCVNFNGLNSMNIHLENIHNDNIDSYYWAMYNSIKYLVVKLYLKSIKNNNHSIIQYSVNIFINIINIKTCIRLRGKELNI